MIRHFHQTAIFGLIVVMFLSPVASIASPEQSLFIRSQQEPPFGGVVLRCPDLLHLYETDVLGLALYFRPDLNGSTLLMWWLFRGTSIDDITEDLTYGSENTFLYADDNNLSPGDVYFYKLVITLTKNNQNTNVAVVYSENLIPEYCLGNIYQTLTFSGGEHPVQALSIQEGGVLEIQGGASITSPPGGTATLRCGTLGKGGTLSIESSELTNTRIEIYDGCKSFSLLNNFLHDSGVSLNGDLENNVMRGNTFLYSVNPPGIDLYNGAKANLDKNKGSFILQLKDNCQATLTGNHFTGSVYVAEESHLWLEDNVITGTLGADGYGGASGQEASITVNSTTLRCDPNKPGGISRSYAMSKGSIDLALSRLESIPGVCRYEIQSSSAGSLVTIGDSRVDAKLNVNAGAELLLYNSPSFQGDLFLNGQSAGRLLNNSLFGNDIWVTDEANLIMEDNVFLDPWIEMDVHSKGVFKHNTLRGTPPGYAFDISSSSNTPDLMIRENCIEVDNGVIIRNNRVNQTNLPLDLLKNWWGHASGPRHNEFNPEGHGAYIADETDYGNPAPVDFSSYYNTPAFCYMTPPRLPQTASGIITAAGGAIYAPDGSAQLQFPPGAVSQDTRVTYREQREDDTTNSQLDAALLPPTGDRTGVRFFDLTAVISDTGQAVITFNLPYTLTINYSDAEASSTGEGSLSLYFWDGSQWQRETSAVVYPVQNRLVAQPNHMTLFAILGESRTVYLPMLRNR